MFRCTASRSFKATAAALKWTAKDDDPFAPDTTFRNVKPGLLLRWWRQVRQRAWMLWVPDEEWRNPVSETFQYTTRMEQAAFFPTSSYGSVPGSYSDPVLYNTKTTSPFRWHGNEQQFEFQGHWYMEADEIFRIKDWAPKNPDDALEMFPRPPSMTLGFEETVDQHGNRSFKYKYRYEISDPHGNAYQAYPFGHMYGGGDKDFVDRVESFGFKQGHLLRCNEEEEAVLRRVMEEEDKEWDMVKRTEIVQEPWTFAGKIRSRDLEGSLERAKARWHQGVKDLRPSDPSEDPKYDLVKAGEYVEPRDGPRAEWRHLWQSERGDKPLPYQTTNNDGPTAEDNAGKPPAYPIP